LQVSSSLSQLPPLPTLSPNPTGSPSFSHSQQHHSLHKLPSSTHLHPSSSSASSSYAISKATRPALPTPSSSSVVILPDGTALPTAPSDSQRSSERAHEAGVGRSVQETLAHSSPSSPWSLLTVHVLPLFAGGPLKTPIEDLK
jgi:hypothetical protein